MFNFFLKSIKKFNNSISAQVVVLAIATLFFFHETLKMQFWKDDYALLYNLQQKQPTYFPYQHLADMFAPFFSIFDINPLGYFFLGILSVFISALVFYYFVYKLFSNKFLAFLACLIYITVPIGIDSVLMMMTFSINYFALALLLLILIAMILFYEKKKLFYYLIALVLFAVSLELVPFRSFYFGGIIILFEIVNLKPSLFVIIGKLINSLGRKIKIVPSGRTVPFNHKEKISFINFSLRQILLISIWVFVLYIIPVYFFPDELKYHPESNAGIFKNIVDYKLLLYPLLTNINVFFAGIAYIFYHNFYLTYNFFITTAILIISLLFLIYLFIWLKKKDKKMLNIYLFNLGFLYMVSLAVYPYSSREIMLAANRYLTNSIPAYSILIVFVYIFLSKVFKKNKFTRILPVFFIFIIILINVGTSQAYLKEFNTRSYYSTQFSEQLKTFVPKLPKNALLYFQLSEDANINYRLLDTSRGGHFDDRAYFGVLYNLKQDEINLAFGNFAVLLDNVERKKIDINKIFAFEYNENGLTDITESIRKSVGEKL